MGLSGSTTYDTVMQSSKSLAAIAQLGERQTEDLRVPGSIPGLGNFAVRPEECISWVYKAVICCSTQSAATMGAFGDCDPGAHGIPLGCGCVVCFDWLDKLRGARCNRGPPFSKP